ncbi:hypothetical protein P775_00965 [Puniceibacterium antarcticum]|uniref:Uncharacterized protein n=1 Tax=Puniceibacterium antarcticum TaxID=1206336 RepID=A0A2G8RKJ6_9RHOB|nr:hypothetical protein [Puniceibacterium antarcticum]PIL22067.1 hypothetical protein P775_00965 [Puniceibacterium antarcticum]
MAGTNTVLGAVSVFNSTATQIYITVNNGADRFLIFPAATATDWMPSAVRPPLSLCSYPAPGVIGVGPNYVSITPATAPGIANATIVVPTSVQTGDALQLYLAAESSDANMWMLLCNGEPVAGSVHIE